MTPILHFDICVAISLLSSTMFVLQFLRFGIVFWLTAPDNGPWRLKDTRGDKRVVVGVRDPTGSRLNCM